MGKRMKSVLIALLLLTALKATSQEDTVKIPIQTAKQIVLDLNELDTLRVANKINRLLLSNYKAQNKSYEISLGKKELQIELLKDNIALMKPEKWYIKLLGILKWIGVGVAGGLVLGSL